jgi:hypothetical protein
MMRNNDNQMRRLNEIVGYDSTVSPAVRISLETDLGGPFWVRLRRADSIMYQERNASESQARDRFERVVENHVEGRRLSE